MLWKLARPYVPILFEASDLVPPRLVSSISQGQAQPAMQTPCETLIISYKFTATSNNGYLKRPNNKTEIRTRSERK